MRPADLCRSALNSVITFARSCLSIIENEPECVPETSNDYFYSDLAAIRVTLLSSRLIPTIASPKSQLTSISTLGSAGRQWRFCKRQPLERQSSRVSCGENLFHRKSTSKSSIRKSSGGKHEMLKTTRSTGMFEPESTTVRNTSAHRCSEPQLQQLRGPAWPDRRS